jgi:hypothetical protein
MAAPAAVLSLLLAGAPSAPPPRIAWADSTAGIHTILIGDGSDNATEVKALATTGAAPDFIWGGSASNIAQWRQLNPEIVITKYVSYSWDPISSKYSWWFKTHPDWIMYKCDRKTPAFKCYSPAPCDFPLPLDITNPEVVQYQIDHGVLPAKAQGFNGIAWDNFDLGNGMNMCGHFDKSGDWVAMYNGTNETSYPDGREKRAQDVVELAGGGAVAPMKASVLCWG